ncbi:hypothetical protein Dimus_039097 [Dionaea muscipula]
MGIPLRWAIEGSKAKQVPACWKSPSSKLPCGHVRSCGQWSIKTHASSETSMQANPPSASSKQQAAASSSCGGQRAAERRRAAAPSRGGQRAAAPIEQQRHYPTISLGGQRNTEHRAPASSRACEQLSLDAASDSSMTSGALGRAGVAWASSGG